MPARKWLRLGIAAPAVALTLVGLPGPAGAGGEPCDPGVGPGCGIIGPPIGVPYAPMGVPYAYENNAGPRWTSNGWSTPPTRPVDGPPPPGPFVYMPPAYAVPHNPCVADCSRGFPFLPWNWLRW